MYTDRNKSYRPLKSQLLNFSFWGQRFGAIECALRQNITSQDRCPTHGLLFRYILAAISQHFVFSKLLWYVNLYQLSDVFCWLNCYNVLSIR